MEQTNEVKHGCKNCIYFSEFYVMNNWKIHRTYNGICHRRNFRLMDKNKFPIEDGCKYWEEREIKPIDYEDLYRHLKHLQKELCGIIILLKEQQK